MTNWFTCKVSYEKTAVSGAVATVTEEYLVDALSFTEAEARIIEEMRPYISGEFAVTGIRRARFSEVFLNADDGRFYRVKLSFITLNEKSGAEKRTASQLLVEASTLKGAIAVMEDGMKGTVADYEIVSASETHILDVFAYRPTGQEASV